jgi:alkanesulfonate monooxygenase SsuD/methylene tetrahydromethanopterin reductase-like flavin-dependent oxidoreductase (luciferase family)
MPVSFGIKTNPVHTSYEDILRVWQEADTVTAIGHAWLWDHMLPLYGPVDGPIFEGWTLLAALAARTERLDLGLLVTSNRVRPPAVLAKIAATVDAVSRGRLVMGIGVGGTDKPDRPRQELAVREYEAYGLDLVPPAEGIEALAESCVIMRRMWTEDVVDFDGRHYRLRGTRCEPKPVRRVPILIGGWSSGTLRVVAEHADVWNIAGPPHSDIAFIRQRSAILEEHCAAIGRNPREIAWSVLITVSYADPAATRATVLELVDAGVTHIVLNIGPPFPDGVARWVADEIIEPVRAAVPVA